MSDLKNQLDVSTQKNNNTESELQKVIKERESITQSHAQLKQQSMDKEHKMNEEKIELEK